MLCQRMKMGLYCIKKDNRTCYVVNMNTACYHHDICHLCRMEFLVDDKLASGKYLQLLHLM